MPEVDPVANSKSDVKKIFSERLSKLKQLHDDVDKQSSLPIVSVPSESTKKPEVPAQTSTISKIPPPISSFSKAESSLTKSLPFQSLSKAPSNQRLYSSSSNANSTSASSRGLYTCMGMIFMLAVGVSLTMMAAEESMVDQDMRTDLIAHKGGEAGKSHGTAYLDTKLAGFQANEAEGYVDEDITEQMKMEEVQLGPSEIAENSNADEEGAMASSSQAPLPDMTGRNTCMNATRPWDPFLFGAPLPTKSTGAVSSQSSAPQHRRLLASKSKTSSKTKKSKETSSEDLPSLPNPANFNQEVFFVCKKAKENVKGGVLTPETQALRDCLKASDKEGGSCQGLMDLESLRKAALQLPGVKKLMEIPQCMTVSSAGKCTKWSGNKETEYHNMRMGVELEAPTHLEKKDIKAKNWKTCALVGQTPQIRKAENGAVIDSHEAVWRFNLDTPTGVKKYAGHKTEVRVLNVGASEKASMEKYKELVNITWKEGEHKRWLEDVVNSEKKRKPQDWIMWNVRSNMYLKTLAETYKPYAQRVIAPEFVNWMLEVYFTIMADLENMGLGPFSCEVNKLLTGTHAIFMSAMACEQTNIFGMAYIDASKTNSDIGISSALQEEKQNYEFDGYMFRLLHIAGRISICTR